MGKRAQKLAGGAALNDEPEYGVANFEKICKFLRAELPTKLKFYGKKPAQYFSGKKMVEFLQESKFFSKEDDDEGCLYGEVECIDVGRRMLAIQRIVRCEFYERKIKKKDGTIKMRKELRPVHPGFQVFDSSKDIPYVWNYDPVTSKTVMYGFLLLGGIAACVALPMWPAWIRNIVIGILMFILVGRPLLWLIVYLVTFSRWNFYVLPKLDEDACPFDKRFWPIWEFERSETASKPDDEEKDSDDDSDGDDDTEGEGKSGSGSADDSKTVSVGDDPAKVNETD